MDARPSKAGAVLACALLAAGARESAAEEWRLTNAASIHGTWRVAEVEFYADTRCSERLQVQRQSAYVRPLPAGTQYQLPVQHGGEDCWGQCKARAGACEWCGPQGACCKEGSLSDPAECRRAGGFTQNFHECVAVPTPGGGDPAGLASPAALAFDEDLETSLEVPCAGPRGCPGGSLVVGAELQPEQGEVRCIVVLQPAEHLTSMGGAATPAPTRLLASRSLRPITSCPGICRSGRFIEAQGSGVCFMYLNSHGHCTAHPPAGFDCKACRARADPDWEAALLPLVDKQLRFGGAFTATRFHDQSGASAIRDASSYVMSKLKEGPATAWIPQRPSPPSPLVLHPGADCWGQCMRNASGAGYCTWCGEGGACCKRGLESDPAECRGASGFASEHHECVLARPRAASEASLPPLLLAGALLGSWGAAAALCWLLPVRRQFSRLCPALRGERADGPAGGGPKALRGDIRVDLLRPAFGSGRQMPCAALREETSKLQFLP